MDLSEYETIGLPDGSRGGGDRTPPRVHRTPDIPSAPVAKKQLVPEGPLGKATGFSSPSREVLHERREPTIEPTAVAAIDQFLGRSSARRMQLLVELAGTRPEDERYWELIDEIDAIQNSRGLIRGLRFD